MKHPQTIPHQHLKNCPLCSSERIATFVRTSDFFLSGEKFDISECHECGHLFTNPQPLPEQLPLYYQSEKYLSHKEKAESFYEKIYAAIRWLNLRTKYGQVTRGLQKGQLLDYGCGRGDFLSLAKEKGWVCTGIEQDEDARKFAQNNAQLDVFPPDEVFYDFTHRFDLITMFHVLEHIPDPHNLLEQINSWLKPGGRLAVALPNPLSFDAKYYGKYWAAWDVPRHLHHFKPSVITATARSHGFELQRVHPMLWDSFFVAMLSEQYKKTGLALVRAGLIGLYSNFNALISGEYSSLLYIFKKIHR